MAAFASTCVKTLATRFIIFLLDLLFFELMKLRSQHVFYLLLQIQAWRYIPANCSPTNLASPSAMCFSRSLSISFAATGNLPH